MENYKIPLRNRNKEIVNYTIVSKDDYEHLSTFKWYVNDGYVRSQIDNKIHRLHRYIMINILKNNIDNHIKIDHINNNKLDNRRENLRIVSNAENSRNKSKAKNSSSKYFGVHWNKDSQKFRVKIKFEDLELRAEYDNELHAAWQYNLWINEHNITCSKINEIEKPKDFIKWKPYKKLGENLPTGVYKIKEGEGNVNRFYARYCNKRLGTYDTIEEAKKVYDDYKIKQVKEYVLPFRVENNNDEYHIDIFNKKNIKIGTTIIDKNSYDIIKSCKLSISNSYVNINLDNKKLLHRFLLNYDGKNVIDHINSNPLDNRKCNLRIVTIQVNSQNKSKAKNKSSKYLGVYLDKKQNVWKASIKLNNKNKHLGSFKNEDDAAKARDKAILIHYNGIGKLNFPK